MKPISEASACVVDHGLFSHIAVMLAEKFGKVFYTGPAERVMRKFEDDAIADGIENITRIQSVWEVDEHADVFVFPDIGFGAEQQKLVRDGRAVWGHRGADHLEVMKGAFFKALEECGLEVPPHDVVKGMTNLMVFLEDKTDRWVKISKWRGDWETFHWRNAEMDMDYLRGHPYNRCPAREQFTFYVMEKIDTDIEDGIDTWYVGGWPKNVLHAMERKDKSLIGGMQKMSAISPEIGEVNEAFGNALKWYGYRGAFSTEVRPPYFIDPTCRFGSPPSQLQSVLITNLAEVIYHGAQGELVEPEWDDPMGAQVLITTDKEKEEWLTFPLDDDLRPFVKSAFSCEVDGIRRITPNPLENWAGWLVATGKTIEDVVVTLQDRKKSLPEGFDCDLSSLSDLLRELDAAKEQGIKITNQPIPEPAIVLDET